MYGTTWRDLQTTPRDIAWRMIRNLRSARPGYAGSGARSRVFDASLEQAEQLFRAAEQVGPQSRPLLLFYGLSQAGRAICASATNVSNNEAHLSGHGIKVVDLAAASKLPLSDLAIRPQAGSFRQVAKALGSSDFSDQISLGRLWGMLPDSDRFPLPGAIAFPPMSLAETFVPGTRVGCTVQPLPPDLQYRPPDTVTAARGDEAAWQAERKRISDYLATYPSLVDFEFLNSSGPAQLSLIGDGEGSLSVVLCWDVLAGEVDRDVLDRYSTTYLSDRLAFPKVGNSSVPAHPITLWWGILYTLSMLARYQPDAWAKYVDVSNSSAAVPIEDLLNRALSVLPETIHRAIVQVST